MAGTEAASCRHFGSGPLTHWRRTEVFGLGLKISGFELDSCWHFETCFYFWIYFYFWTCFYSWICCWSETLISKQIGRDFDFEILKSFCFLICWSFLIWCCQL